MKNYRFLIIFSLVMATTSTAGAANEPSTRWDTLIEIAYRFTWYPQKDLQNLLETKSKEYGQSLEEYRNLMASQVIDKEKPPYIINKDLLVKGRPWKLLYRFAISQFCIYLTNNDAQYLQNAKTIMTLLVEKKEMPKISFWYYLFQAYSQLLTSNHDLFVSNVYNLWQYCIFNTELENMLISPYNKQTSISSELPYFYENVAHLILAKAVIEKQLSNLFALSPIIVSLKNKLALDNGYRPFVEAIVSRLDGLKSDNYNLNFAVALVEATANQYEFEDEKSIPLVLQKYYAVRKSYEIALSLAQSAKAKAAILSQYMGFNNYLLQRLIDESHLLSANSPFLGVPGDAYGLTDKAFGLYDQFATSASSHNVFPAGGFNDRMSCIEAMHQLWDSSAKLLITLAEFYRTNHILYKASEHDLAAGPLLKYLAFFDRYAMVDREILPDNAFYLTAFAASKLSELYENAAKYSTNMQFNNYAFYYQVQAVKLFPLNILAILKLAHQADQENRYKMYVQDVIPLASRLRDSKVIMTWFEKPFPNSSDSIDIIRNVMPNIIDNAFLFINVLQHTDNIQVQRERTLYNTLLIIAKLHSAIRDTVPEKDWSKTLISTVQRYSPESSNLSKQISEAVHTSDFDKILMISAASGEKYNFTVLKNQLYASPNSELHTLLRELYFENHEKIHTPFILSQPILF